ncbi:MAG: DUF4191 domain-containing protein [Actinomyces sp.]|nr:DUF4191 domain-containing protein [Actinomyces sp.]
MAENTKAPAEKKRRWYKNLADAYRITQRTYPWIGWAIAGVSVAVIALCVVVAVLTHANVVLWTLTGVMLAVLLGLVLLSSLVRKAMYAQIDGTVGSVYAVISQIKRGWIISEEPVAANREQDVIWRLIGRPGVVFISEGPSARVRPMLAAERKRVNRVAQNVPVILIQSGHEDGQVTLAKIEKTLRKQKKVLTKEEVPAISQRLNAVQSTSLPIPKGIDPTHARPNRRAMRGR